MKQTKKNANTKKQRRNLYIGIAFIAVFVVVAILILSGQNQDTPETALERPTKPYTQPSASAADTLDLVIQKSDITETADFIAYQAGNTDMEVIAVQAPDGTIRTALNTCQVCYDSGRGYYEQDGDELVCQNCGNRFSISEIGDTQFGCNPVPITAQYQSEDDQTITISAAFLADNAELFKRWKS